MKKILDITLRIIAFVAIVYFSVGFTFKHFNSIYVKEVQAFQETITTQREIANPVELTAISDKIVETNMEIAKLRTYYNIPIFSIFFCEDFKTLEMVK